MKRGRRRQSGAMSASWHGDDEEYGGSEAKSGFRSKPRFTFNEVRVLLEAVKRNRYIILKKFNHGVSAETKKQTWTDITNQVNSLGQSRREVRQIMKKWADLKCDGKRRIVALRGPNGSSLRKKKLGPVEKMVHKILTMNPRDGESDADAGKDDSFSPFRKRFPNPPPYSYLSLTDSSHSGPSGASVDLSPLSSPEKELGGDAFHSSSDLDFGEDGERTVGFDENDDSVFSNLEPSSLDPLPENARMRLKPVYTYSRSSSQIYNQSSSRPPPGPLSSVASTSSVFPSVSDSNAAPAPTSCNSTTSSVPPSSSSSSLPLPTSSAVADSAVAPSAAASSSSSGASSTSASSSAVNAHGPPASSSVPLHPPTLGSNLSDPLPGAPFHRRLQDPVAQMASQSVQQQQASRVLLTSVSQSLEILAQSVQLLVETQQEFVQESLLLQRETVDILKDFSNTALTMLRDKANSGHLATNHHPHPPSHF